MVFTVSNLKAVAADSDKIYEMNKVKRKNYNKALIPKIPKKTPYDHDFLKKKTEKTKTNKKKKQK